MAEPAKNERAKSEAVEPKSTMLTVQVLWACHAWNTTPEEAAKQVVADLYEHLKRIAQRREGPVILDVTAHAHIYGRPPGAHYYEKIIAAAAKHKDAWIATRLDIAEFTLARK